MYLKIIKLIKENNDEILINKNKRKRRKNKREYKKEKKNCIKKEDDVTVLIPTYNVGGCILETIKSIKTQKYCGDIFIKITDDGSTDKTVELLENEELDDKFEVLKLKHLGKAGALNEGLKCVKTKYVITVDSDTILHGLAIRKIMNKLQSLEQDIAATAGSVFVKNPKKNLITKIQECDYTLGILGVKLLQGNYNSMLVAQGAFSAYRTDKFLEIEGWQDCVGENIVLTWKLLAKGYKTNFVEEAIAFTEVPETFKKLGKQRKRWARGMIEAFKRVNPIKSNKIDIKSKILIFFNIFFPFIDLALLIFVPLSLVLFSMGNKLLVSWISLLVIPLGLMLCILIEYKRKETFKKIDYILEKRSKIAFIFYILIYAFILAPYCLIGYISELINLKRKW